MPSIIHYCFVSSHLFYFCGLLSFFGSSSVHAISQQHLCLYFCSMLSLNKTNKRAPCPHIHDIPVKNLSSQLTHWELTWKSQKAHPAWVTVSSFWGHLFSLQCSHKMSSLWDCCELSVSLQLSQWAHCYHCMVSHQMISQISHSKLTVWVWTFLKFLVFTEANDKHIQAN